MIKSHMDLARVIKANIILQVNGCSSGIHSKVLVAIHRHPDLHVQGQAVGIQELMPLHRGGAGGGGEGGS